MNRIARYLIIENFRFWWDHQSLSTPHLIGLGYGEHYQEQPSGHLKRNERDEITSVRTTSTDLFLEEIRNNPTVTKSVEEESETS
jgi:hypothetical protein